MPPPRRESKNGYDATTPLWDKPGLCGKCDVSRGELRGRTGQEARERSLSPTARQRSRIARGSQTVIATQRTSYRETGNRWAGCDNMIPLYRCGLGWYPRCPSVMWGEGRRWLGHVQSPAPQSRQSGEFPMLV